MVLALGLLISSLCSTLLFAMLQLCTPALLLAALAGIVLASRHDSATTLEIVSKTIAPDGYSRP